MTRRLLSAPVLLAVAIVVLGSGTTAVAAHHYVITSTKQIKPKVLKKLHGATGVPGPPGTPGLGLTAGQVLPSGASETGTYAGNADTGADITIDLEFRPRLATSLPAAQVHFVTSPTAVCPGTVDAPTAARGHLCLYQGGLANATFNNIFTLAGVGDVGAGPLGAVVFFDSSAITGRAYGTWAVTAP